MNYYDQFDIINDVHVPILLEKERVIPLIQTIGPITKLWKEEVRYCYNNKEMKKVIPY